MAFQRVYRFLVWKTDIYVLRSSVLSICQQPGVFSLPLVPSCLAPSSSCSSSTFGVFLLLHSSVHPSIFSLSHLFFFFYHLSTFSSFSFLSNYLSLLDRRSIFISPFIFSCTFPAFSSSHPFLQSLYPSFCLSYSSFFVCFRSLSFFCISSSIFHSLFLSKVPRARRL